MGWRYQPIWTESKGERSYGLIEVFLDHKDQLTQWTADPHTLSAHGETIEELQNDTSYMMLESLCWKPVAFDKLKVGMTFELNVPATERDRIKAALLREEHAKRILSPAMRRRRGLS